VTDDAELRARIEAQVAARRADAASSESDETPETHAQESPQSDASARGGKGLTPTRPWQRGSGGADSEALDEPPVAADAQAGAPTGRRGGVGPTRPWARRAAQAAKAQQDLPLDVSDETAIEESADGKLHPARPWRGRPAAEARVESGTAAPAPSHPHVVLHGIGEEDAGGTPTPPPRMRGLLQRGAGKRRSDDSGPINDRQRDDERSAAARDLAKRRAEAELRLAAEREEAERALAEERAAAERELAEQRAAAERELAEQRAEAERQLAEQREAAQRELAEQRAEAERLRAEREEAERVLAERRAAMEELPETTAVYVPDDEAVGAFAEAAGALQDQPLDDVEEPAEQGGRWTRRKRRPKDAVIAAEPVASTADISEETREEAGVDVPTGAVDEPVTVEVPTVAAEPVVAASMPDEDAAEPAAEESYPWQQKDEVDLDLHGAPTYDPGMYPPEDEEPQQRRGRRALRWLLARAPEPQTEDIAATAADEPEPVEPPTYEPEPRVELPVAHLPVENFVTRETSPAEEVDEAAPAEEAAALAEPAVEGEAPATVDDADVAPAATDLAEPAEKKRSSLFGRLRRRRDEESDEEPEEAFALPPVDEAWLEPPKPTRDWATRSAPIELGATPDEIAAVVESEPEAEPALEAETDLEPVAAVESELVAVVEPEPEPEPVAAVEPEVVPEPEPEAEPEPVVRRRPSPGAAAGVRRPSPGVAAAAASTAAEAAVAAPPAEPRRRPSPGVAPAAAAATSRTGRPLPFELAGSAAPTTAKTQTAPDISRFLEATEADDDVDVDEDDDDRKTGRWGGGGDGRWKKTLTRTGVTLLIAALAAVLLRVFIVQPYYIPSASMEPTLHGCPGCNDDHVLVDKISYDVHAVRAGDIVVFHKPDNAQVPEDVLIKRVIALAGDRISMTHGRVYINGGLLDEGYLNKDHSCYATDPSENFGPRTVPKGDVFVMGDNRCNSEDSREFGPISTSSIIGRAFMIVWPLDRIRFLGS
jgi:signal peptidase I